MQAGGIHQPLVNRLQRILQRARQGIQAFLYRAQAQRNFRLPEYILLRVHFVGKG
ncbi:hypothetical protein SDC9_206280 [bioreactor metagenome]|uniref:Uncharacterized protein n=1 Tax=bioreactor metagenome TaxID=1076179 RepID=A0A645JG51_9ZZZZ